jgi:hypothetical protein
MSNRDCDVVLGRLLSDCKAAMSDPCPEMAHWGPYCRLVDFKLAMPLPDERRQLVDAVLMRMRARLAAFVRTQLEDSRRLRLAEVAPSRLNPTEPLAQELSRQQDQNSNGDLCYHGTVRGLLTTMYLRGLRSEFTTGWWKHWRPQVPMLVNHWREAELQAVVAHLNGPVRRVSSYWQPAILRLPKPPSLSGNFSSGEFEDEALIAATLPVDHAEVWLVGEDPRPHWQPLLAVLSRRRASPRPRVPRARRLHATSPTTPDSNGQVA